MFGCTCLAIASHAEELDSNQSDKQRANPSSIVDALGSWPVMYDIASSRDFKGQDSQPTNGVLPAASEAQGGIDEATDVHCEGAVDRIHDGQFREGLHHEVAILCQLGTKLSDI